MKNVGRQPKTSPIAKKARPKVTASVQRPAKLVFGVELVDTACPPATQDIEINLANRQTAIDTAGYGPMNPNEENEQFWQDKADRWKVTIEEAQTSTCGSCAMFVVTPEMKDCIASVIQDESSEADAWTAIDAGGLGYCQAFDFKCSERRTCNAWVVGGPITGGNEPGEGQHVMPDETVMDDEDMEGMEEVATTVLIGALIANPESLPFAPSSDFEFMCVMPYAALVAAEGDVDAICAALESVELIATATITGVMTDPEGTRSALELDSVAVESLVELILGALEGIAEAQVFPPMVQLGAVPAEELESLIGTTIDLTNVVVMGSHGTIAEFGFGPKGHKHPHKPGQAKKPADGKMKPAVMPAAPSKSAPAPSKPADGKMKPAVMPSKPKGPTGNETARPGAGLIQEDETPFKSPGGADPVDFNRGPDGNGPGVMIYADGAVYDGLGWQDNGDAPKVGGAPDGKMKPAVMPPSYVPPKAASVAKDAVKGYASEQKWEGMLVIEGIMSGDGRKIEMNALTWRELPLPLMVMTENPVGGGGHDGARLGGRIDWIERRMDGQIWGGGVLDTASDAGREAQRLMTPDQSGRALLRGVSVDLDDVEMLLEEGSTMDSLIDGTGQMQVGKARIMGATLTPFPAFQEAQVILVGDILTASLSGEDCDCLNSKALTAAAGRPKRGAEMRVFTPFGVEALVASASIPVNPPLAWFKQPKFEGATPMKVLANGRIYGHVAAWGSCHIGFKDRCVSVPKSSFRYRYFANKQTLTAEGKMVGTGPIVIDTVHPDLQMRASDAQAFYADTGCAVADVALYEDEYGIVAAGAVRPSASPEQIRKLRGSDVSPDWRQINGKLECVGLLGVNTSGFVTPALVASAMKYGGRLPRTPGKVAATMKNGKVTSLVAAGMITRSDTATLESEVEQLKAFLAPIIEERQKALDVRAGAARSKLTAASQKARRENALAKFKKKR